jgi:hypothetical protein
MFPSQHYQSTLCVCGILGGRPWQEHMSGRCPMGDSLCENRQTAGSSRFQTHHHQLLPSPKSVLPGQFLWDAPGAFPNAKCPTENSPPSVNCCSNLVHHRVLTSPMDPDSFIFMHWVLGPTHSSEVSPMLDPLLHSHFSHLIHHSPPR